MPPITCLTREFAVAGALSAGDFESLRGRGFRAVINFRPDGESASQLSAAEASAAAGAVGLDYHHIPTTKLDVFTDDVVSRAAAVFSGSRGPILAYCASGQRAAIVWAAAQARAVQIDTILTVLADAGFDFAFLRDDLDAQADRARWTRDVSTASDLADPPRELVHAA